MNDLFLWLVVLLVVVVVMNRRARRPQEKDKLALTYRRVPGSDLDLARLRDDDAKWSPLWLEDMPFAERRRLVLSVLADPLVPLERLETLLWKLARDLQERALAHVVVVEAYGEREAALAGKGRLRLLYAPDGRGWSGEEEVIATLEAENAPAEQLGLAQVHTRLLALDEG